MTQEFDDARIVEIARPDMIADLHADVTRRHTARQLEAGGLGILQVRKRAARMGRNPATGEPIQIKASKKVAFRASKELKEAI